MLMKRRAGRFRACNLGWVGVSMRKILLAAVGLLASGALFSAAEAGVVVRVSKARQTMYVYVDGYLEHVWPVSTARDGYITPNGVYHPTALDPYHRSSRYNNSPMPPTTLAVLDALPLMGASGSTLGTRVSFIVSSGSRRERGSWSPARQDGAVMRV